MMTPQPWWPLCAACSKPVDDIWIIAPTCFLVQCHNQSETLAISKDAAALSIATNCRLPTAFTDHSTAE